jgi:tetratricopeptide (TPR) repeat protein
MEWRWLTPWEWRYENWKIQMQGCLGIILFFVALIGLAGFFIKVHFGKGAAERSAIKSINKATDLSKQKKYDEALRELDKAASKLPSSPVVYQNRGLTHYLKGNSHEALADFNRALALNPDLSFLYVWRGETQRRIGNYDAALLDLSKAIDLKQEEKKACYFRGRAYQDKGITDSALADFRKALEFDPNYADVHVQMGYLFQKTGNPGRAFESFSAALDRGYPDPGLLRFLQARCLISSNRYSEALKALDDLIRSDPEFPTNYFHRARTLMALGRREQALSDIEKASSLVSDPVRAGTGRALFFFSTGDFSAAAGEYRKTAALAPARMDIKTWIFLAESFAGRNTTDELREAIRTAVNPDPWDIAVARMCLGDLASEECVRIGTSKKPELAKQYKVSADFYTAQILLVRGQKDLARDMLKHCVQASDTNDDYFGDEEMLAGIELDLLGW